MPVAVDYRSIITRAMSRTGQKITAVPKTAELFRGQIDYFNFLASRKAGLLLIDSAQAPMQITGAEVQDDGQDESHGEFTQDSAYN